MVPLHHLLLPQALIAPLSPHSLHSRTRGYARPIVVNHSRTDLPLLLEVAGWRVLAAGTRLRYYLNSRLVFAAAVIAGLESVGVEGHADVGGLGGSCGAGDVVDLPVGVVALRYGLVEWLPHPLPIDSLNKSLLVGLK